MNGDYKKRPELQRDHPYRQFSGIWTQAASQFGSGKETSSSESEQPGGSSGEFVEQGVRSAYDVIDTYIQQGQKIAQDLAGLSYTDMPLLETTQEMQGRWMQLSSELLANWLDLIGMAFQTVLPESAGQADAQVAPADPVPIIQWDIDCPIPARLKAELAPGAGRFALSCAGLIGEADVPAIPIAFETRFNDGSVGVKLNVSATQPVGRYVGSIVNTQTGEILGEAVLELY